MPASWVAASVRARLLGGRRLGAARATAVASSGGLGPALEMLTASPYGKDLDLGMSLEAAQRQVAATTLWHLRLLAGWLPPGGAAVLQPLLAWFEIANIEERLTYLSGGGHPAPYQLGRMSVAWAAASRATTPAAVREALARSHWGDPGTDEAAPMVLRLRFRWAAWVADSVPGAWSWAATAVALLAARIRFAGLRSDLPAETVGILGLPTGWQQAATPSELRAMLPARLSWVLDGVTQPSDLWIAEARWWARVKDQAAEMVLESRYGPPAVVGMAALLGFDAWLTRAALSAAARGISAKRAFDAVV